MDIRRKEGNRNLVPVPIPRVPTPRPPLPFKLRYRNWNILIVTYLAIVPCNCNIKIVLLLRTLFSMLLRMLPKFHGGRLAPSAVDEYERRESDSFSIYSKPISPRPRRSEWVNPRLITQRILTYSVFKASYQYPLPNIVGLIDHLFYHLYTIASTKIQSSTRLGKAIAVSRDHSFGLSSILMDYCGLVVRSRESTLLFTRELDFAETSFESRFQAFHITAMRDNQAAAAAKFFSSLSRRWACPAAAVSGSVPHVPGRRKRRGGCVPRNEPAAWLMAKCRWPPINLLPSKMAPEEGRMAESARAQINYIQVSEGRSPCAPKGSPASGSRGPHTPSGNFILRLQAYGATCLLNDFQNFFPAQILDFLVPGQFVEQPCHRGRRTFNSTDENDKCL
ncbi:unnamed protein product [Nesidiocoris tenuis]|uniref:Uncharacterized protein n=1 Tax=Nesidiocoris tenuis TaxID=355587 RepID=A0A6H5HCP2_9HEMI|nr:unnamed protein product [Nesidiocoris tenuis]